MSGGRGWGYPDNFLLIFFPQKHILRVFTGITSASQFQGNVINMFRVVAVLFYAVPPVSLTVHQVSASLDETVRGVIRKRSYGCKIFNR